MNRFIEQIAFFFKMNDVKTEKEIGKILTRNSMTISTAESCTGGLISSRLTDIAGSSAYIKENYVTYANEVKEKLLNVSDETLKNHGAVSEQCAKEMSEGLFKATGSDVALAITGLAGPGGAVAGKNVGLVFVGIKTKNFCEVRKFELNPKNERKMMKLLFAKKALQFLLEILTKNTN